MTAAGVRLRFMTLVDLSGEHGEIGDAGSLHDKQRGRGCIDVTVT